MAVSSNLRHYRHRCYQSLSLTVIYSTESGGAVHVLATCILWTGPPTHRSNLPLPLSRPMVRVREAMATGILSNRACSLIILSIISIWSIGAGVPRRRAQLRPLRAGWFTHSRRRQTRPYLSPSSFSSLRGVGRPVHKLAVCVLCRLRVSHMPSNLSPSSLSIFIYSDFVGRTGTIQILLLIMGTSPLSLR